MKFEFDSNKSQTNKAKHGIDFIEAQELWEDSNRLYQMATTTDEPRFLVIGKIRDKIWTAVITPRGDAIRIISVRRARKEEVRDYEQ